MIENQVTTPPEITTPTDETKNRKPRKPRSDKGKPRKSRTLLPLTAVAADGRELTDHRLPEPALPDKESITESITVLHPDGHPGGAASRAKLPTEIRRLIVELLACHMGPTAVCRWLGQYTGFVVTPQEVSYYDPTKRAGAQLGFQWRTLFFDMRRNYEAYIESISMAGATWRLEQLSLMYESVMSKDQPNLPLAAQLLEQGAKEAAGHWAKVAASPVDTEEMQLEKLRRMSPEDRVVRFMELVKIGAQNQANQGMTSGRVLDILPAAARKIIEAEIVYPDGVVPPVFDYDEAESQPAQKDASRDV